MRVMYVHARPREQKEYQMTSIDFENQLLDLMRQLTQEIRLLRKATEDLVYDLDEDKLLIRRSDKQEPVCVQQEEE